MSTRRDQEGPEQKGPGQPIMRKVSFNPVEGMIGSPGMGVNVHRVWAEWKGDEVDEIPEGEAFDIKVDYTSSWPEGNVSFYNPWAVSFTAMCLQDSGIYAYGITRTNESPHRETMVLDDPQSIRMPGFDCTFRIRPHGHPDGATGTPPPRNEW